jgi:NADPH-dependent curcumin reductase CurA
MSADPYLRGHVKSPVAAKVVPGTIGLGQPMNGFIAGKIVASKNPDWVVGDLIGAALPFTTL